MDSSAFIFHAHDLDVGYKPDAALFSNLSLSLLPGELVCLMGPNGSGKSTLIRTLAGLHPALRGMVPHSDRKFLSVVLTDKISSSHMTAIELITYGRYPHLDWSISMSDSDRAVIDRVVSQVHVENLLHKKLYELSDGQLQMVMIARALVQETAVILLDEPTAHLDLNNRLEIMNLLGKLAHAERKAILVATHELDLALQTADKIWLVTGRTISAGIPEDLVLNGSIDEVFQLKGFDLKTGRVQHHPFRDVRVRVIGEGSLLMWTRNALERNGFAVDDKASVTVQIETAAGWKYADESFTTLEALLKKLITNQVNSRS